MSDARILIIGAGLAGLSLGQGLKQVGIPFRIFERDQAASFRAQGYRIRIDERGGNALRNLLPTSLFQHFEATCAEVIKGGHRLDAMTSKPTTTHTSRVPPPQLGPAWNADRTVLRNVLLTGLEEHIEYGKKIEKYHLVDNGAVAQFTDGSREEGRMIIGSDGTRSQVRKQMLPDHVLLDTLGRAVFGKTPVGLHTFESIPAEIGNGICLIGADAEPRMKLFCDMMKFNRNVGVELPQDYVYWVLLFDKACTGKSDAELLSLSNAQSAALADSLTSDWHHAVRAIVSQQLPEAASTLQFLMAKPPIEPWQADARVTLMGDAAHPMIPAGGVGANTAFQDAADLLNVLKDGLDNDSLAQHEQSMRERSSAAVMRSAGAGPSFFGMKSISELKPVDDLHKA